MFNCWDALHLLVMRLLYSLYHYNPSICTEHVSFMHSSVDTCLFKHSRSMGTALLRPVSTQPPDHHSVVALGFFRRDLCCCSNIELILVHEELGNGLVLFIPALAMVVFKCLCHQHVEYLALGDGLGFLSVLRVN